MLKRINLWRKNLADKALERYYRYIVDQFADGLAKIAMAGDEFGEKPDRWDDQAYYDHFIIAMMPDGCQLKIEAGNTLLVRMPERTQIHNVRVFLEREGSWYLVFERVDDNLKRFIYGREWVETLWALIDADAKQIAKEIHSSNEENFGRMD